MITEVVMGIGSRLIALLAGLFAFPEPPAFVTAIPGYVASAVEYLAGTSAWIPWTVGAAVAAAYAVCMSAGLILKGARIVASFLSFGGGSAA